MFRSELLGSLYRPLLRLALGTSNRYRATDLRGVWLQIQVARMLALLSARHRLMRLAAFLRQTVEVDDVL